MLSLGPGTTIQIPYSVKTVHPVSSSVAGHIYSALLVLERAHPEDIVDDKESDSNVRKGFTYDFFT